MKLNRRTAPFVFGSATFILAGGLIHLREWLEVYRHVPADVPGAAVVRVGFPLNAATSLIIAVALLLCLRRQSRLMVPVVIAAVAFEVGALAALIATRTGSLLGWSEPSWTAAAETTRAVELGALLLLGAVLTVGWIDHRRSRLSDTIQVDGSSGARLAAAQP